MNTVFVNAIHIRDIYGVEFPPIPNGWRAVAFRPPSPNDYFIHADEHYVFHATMKYDSHQPRIIVSRVPLKDKQYDRHYELGAVGA